jgi:hypothetical protein
MKQLLGTRWLLYITSVVLIAGCASHRDNSAPISIVAPSPNRPHLILTADRSVVRKGECVEIMVTFVNPTKQRITLPTESIGEDGFDNIEHRLDLDWTGKNGNSSSGMSAVSVNRCPPSFDYLEPGQSKSYRLRWRSEVRGEGVAILTYEFGWGDDFPPVKITLLTR